MEFLLDVDKMGRKFIAAKFVEKQLIGITVIYLFRSLPELALALKS